MFPKDWDRYQTIFERAQVGMMVLGSDCVAVEVNEAAAALTGWTREELVGRRACSELFTPGQAVESICGLIGHTQLFSEHRAPFRPCRLLLYTRSGKELPIMVTALPVPLSTGERGFAILMWDMSEADRVKQELALRRKQAEELAAIGREITAAADISKQLEHFLARARGLVKMDLVAWGRLDQASESLVWEAADGAGSYGLRGARMDLSDRLMGQILLQGRIYITMDLTGEQAANPVIYHALSRPPLATAVIIPFAVGESGQQVLLCASRQRLALTEEDVMLLSHLGGYLATAVEKGHLLDEVKRIATLGERDRLAAEMHDSVGQLLTYVGLRLHAIGKWVRQGRMGAIEQEVSDLQVAIDRAHQEVRGRIYALRQGGAESSSLWLRWQRLLDDFAHRTGILVDYQTEAGVPERLPEVVQAHLTRILQEALANIRNHSGAYSVRVQVSGANGQLKIVLSDDGCGFDPEVARGVERHHFGLTLMAERASAIGAVFEIRSKRGHGTTIALGWPYSLEGERYEPAAHTDSVS